MADIMDVIGWLTYYKPHGNQLTRYESVREDARELAVTIGSLCPDSDERDEAFKKLREVVFWANASIACNEGSGDPPDVIYI